MEVDVSLARALSRLPSDRATEAVIKDIVTFLAHHTDEWITLEEVSRRTGTLKAESRPVLEALHAAYVVDFDEPVSAYRYRYDIGLSIEIDTFLHRTHKVENHVQTNVARFRDRYGAQ
jgi:hypothetical protein